MPAITEIIFRACGTKRRFSLAPDGRDFYQKSNPTIRGFLKGGKFGIYSGGMLAGSSFTPAFEYLEKPVITKKGEKGGVMKIGLMHPMYSEFPPLIKQGAQLWNEGWGAEIFHVTEGQYRAMYRHAPNGILLSFVNMMLAGGIWSLNRDVNEKNPLSKYTYEAVTDGKTFSGHDRFGNTKFCISVVNLSKYYGFRTDDKRTLSQNLVKAQRIIAQRSPYVTRVIAFSRCPSLRYFVEMIWDLRISGKLKKSLGFKDGKILLPDGRELLGDELGIYAYQGTEKEYFSFTKEYMKKESSLIYKDGNYYLPKGKRLYKDKKGIYIKSPETNDKEYLAQFEAYLELQFDLMKRIHGGLGGKIVEILPAGRQGDVDSLGLNVLYDYALILPNDFREFINNLHPYQKIVIEKLMDSLSGRKPINDEGFLREIKLLDQPNADPKALIQDAFSVEKMRMIREILLEHPPLLLSTQ